MTNENAREVTDADVAGLSGKLEEFADGLEPAERALLDALMSQAGGLGESEVEGFGVGSFRTASSAAFDPFKGGILSGDLLGGGLSVKSCDW